MNTQKGFTLVETLVAIFLVVVLIGAVFSIFSSTRKGLSLSENHTNATMVGRSVLNELYNSGYANITSAPRKTVSLSGYNNGNRSAMNYDYTVDVQEDTTLHNKDVSVTVTWPESAVPGRQSKRVIVETVFNRGY